MEDEELLQKVRELQKEAKTDFPMAAYKDDEPLTVELVENFINYTCNYKKHYGVTWKEVFLHDYDYFTWVVDNLLGKETLTYRVFSFLLIN